MARWSPEMDPRQPTCNSRGQAGTERGLGRPASPITLPDYRDGVNTQVSSRQAAPSQPPKTIIASVWSA